MNARAALLRFVRPALAAMVVMAAGCAAPPRQPPDVDATLFHDAAFAAPTVAVSTAGIFALSPAMEQFAARADMPLRQYGDPRRRLVELIYDKGRLALEYDSSVTRNAADTFEARSGNCLSLVIMTAAFAKARGIPVDYRSVVVDEAWSRSGDLYFASGHVNLALDLPSGRSLLNRDLDGPLVVDFLPQEEMRGLRSRPIAEHTVVAMYLNNRAAEALTRGAVDDGYWWAREAVRQDPAFSAALNTLGVVYTHRGRPDWARAVFERLLVREPQNAKAMANLVRALRDDGDPAAADRLTARLAAIEPYPPFHFLRAGIDAMARHDYADARALFAREAARQGDYHEVQFWLAQANFRLGNLAAADRHLELALRNSTTPREHAIYAAKLDWLRAQQRVH